MGVAVLSLLYHPALRAPLLRGGELGDVAVGYHFYTSPPYGHPSLEEGSWGMLRWVVVATPNSPPSKEGYPVRGGVVCQHKTTCKVTTKKLPFIFCHKQNSPLFSFVISKNLRSSFFMRFHLAVGYHFYTSPPYGHPSLEEGSWGMLRWVITSIPPRPTGTPP